MGKRLKTIHHPGGLLVAEIGHGMKENVVSLMQNQGRLVESRKDLQGWMRLFKLCVCVCFFNIQQKKRN
jgi:hypothetical protein